MIKINLGNKILNIGLRIFSTPNKNRLEEELRKYFSQNLIEGKEIKKFTIRNLGDGIYDVDPKEPPLDRLLLGGNYKKDLEKIGEKYGIRKLGFTYLCYKR